MNINLLGAELMSCALFMQFIGLPMIALLGHFQIGFHSKLLLLSEFYRFSVWKRFRTHPSTFLNRYFQLSSEQ